MPSAICGWRLASFARRRDVLLRHWPMSAVTACLSPPLPLGPLQGAGRPDDTVAGRDRTARGISLDPAPRNRTVRIGLLAGAILCPSLLPSGFGPPLRQAQTG